MSFGSRFVSTEGSSASDSSVADRETNEGGGVEISIDAAATASSPKELRKIRSVGFASSGEIRWFMKKESITAKKFDDEVCQIDFSEERRKILRKQAVKSERVQTLPFSMSLLDNGTFAAEASSSKSNAAKPIITNRQSWKRQIQVVLLHSKQYTQILYQTMQHIHQDRDLLLGSLLKWCGFFHGAKTIEDRGGSNVSKGGALATFLTILPPKLGTRALLELFHDGNYLDLLQFPSRLGRSSETGTQPVAVEQHSTPDSNEGASASPNDTETYEDNTASISQQLLAEHGLEDDCPLPTDDYNRALLWNYCLSVAGASWHAASLLADEESESADVAVNWGGGRHHAHSNKAGGFCYVNDIVIAIKRLLQSQSISDSGVSTPSRVLYIDIDIHHCDGVQQAFYSTDRVMTASFHRNAPGFFPANSGFVREKGATDTNGFGYNLNVPLPSGIDDVTFIRVYRKLLFGLVNSFDPNFIVLCVGADGLEDDALVTGKLQSTDHSTTGEGWSLSPEGLAECVRVTSSLCAGLNEEMICTQSVKEEKKEGNKPEKSVRAETRTSHQPGKRRKLLVLGGGGYTPTQTARSYLLCTAAACEGARSGLLWSELPKDIPGHDYFPRYGPFFELVSEEKKQNILNSYVISNSCETSTEKEQLSSTFYASNIMEQGNHAIELACLYVGRQRKKKANECASFKFWDERIDRNDDIWIENSRKKKASQGRRRKKKKQ